MTPNVGGLDKKIRIAAGIFMAAGAYLHSWRGARGITPISTALINGCPGYLAFSISPHKTSVPE
ncbi:MAG: DUF2892 domain-containing protein [Gammaproteobacteria bacterium]|jgi:hypothetical protein|nr:DUF2892 domain-containing protein [Gammaproteobacteria bacterium]MBT4146265.1 DUF2892 domain-containing protein [Gammaproteobacteria bacterium]MBT5223509.1 DUF2892 domain-containing protein [Gammaproteobacteria bacterium]MBT5826617.1 DUF2892 domain-containing protein [Gammaproteobacteria bacterium]MBT5966153.1 DUF2892 domain-containing protein [Gammaproteobacteria bacterium]